MRGKLTLNIDKEIISLAKKFAKDNGKSPSSVVEKYLKTLVAKQPLAKAKKTKVDRLRGSLKLPKNSNYRKTLAGELNKRFFS